MLSLKKNYEFQRVLKKGTRYTGKLLTVCVLKNNKKSNYLGVAVGKKVTKSSVKRNRIKRLIRESYRLNENCISSYIDIVITWKTSCPFELANFKDIENDLIYILNQIENIINREDANV